MVTTGFGLNVGLIIGFGSGFGVGLGVCLTVITGFGLTTGFLLAGFGVGLAAPQVGKAIRLFVIDASPFAEVNEDEEPEFTAEEMKQMDGFKKTFINAIITNEEGEEWKFNEGCLSIPKIREDVLRKPDVTIEYYDENFKKHKETYNGVIARVIQHEYDHIEGILFTDKISPFKRKMISGKLTDISKGKFRADYKTKVFIPKK